MGTVTCCSISSEARPGHCVITWTHVFATSGYASTGRALNARMPQANRRMAMQRTMKRLLRAASTMERIIADSPRSLFHHALEFQRIRDHLLARLDAGQDFLQAAGKHFAADH